MVDFAAIHPDICANIFEEALVSCDMSFAVYRYHLIPLFSFYAVQCAERI